MIAARSLILTQAPFPISQARSKPLKETFYLSCNINFAELQVAKRYCSYYHLCAQLVTQQIFVLQVVAQCCAKYTRVLLFATNFQFCHSRHKLPCVTPCDWSIHPYKKRRKDVEFARPPRAGLFTLWDLSGFRAPIPGKGHDFFLRN